MAGRDIELKDVSYYGHPAGAVTFSKPESLILDFLQQYIEQSRSVISALEQQLERSSEDRSSAAFTVLSKKTLLERMYLEIAEEQLLSLKRNAGGLLPQFQLSIDAFEERFDLLCRNDSRCIPIIHMLSTLEPSLYSAYVMRVRRRTLRAADVAKNIQTIRKFVATDLTTSNRVELPSLCLPHITEFLKKATKDTSWCIASVRTFVKELVDLCCSYDPASWLSDDQQCMSLAYGIEEKVVAPFYSELLSTARVPELDALFSRKCHEFMSASQESVWVKSQYTSKEPVPYIESIALLRTIGFALTPISKLRVILASTESAYERMSALGRPGDPINADELLPVMIYVVLKAGVRDLCSQLGFIASFAQESFFNGEMGYYLSNVEMAVEYIKELTPDKLSPVRSPALETQIVLAERERFLEWAHSSHAPVDVVHADYDLRGYQLYVNHSWLCNPGMLYCTVLVPQPAQGNACKVRVCVLKANHRATAPQLDFLTRTFIAASGLADPLASGGSGTASSCANGNAACTPTVGVVSHVTEGGSTLILESSGTAAAASAASAVPVAEGNAGGSGEEALFAAAGFSLIPDGDFDRAFPDLRSAINMSRCVQRPAAVSGGPEPVDVAFLQKALMYLDYLISVVPYKTGLLDDVTIFSVLRMQQENGVVEDEVGKVGPKTVQKTLQMLAEIRANLLRLQETAVCAALASSGSDLDIDALHEATRLFQKSCGLVPDGRCGSKTRQLLDRILRGETTCAEERQATMSMLRNL